MLFTDTNGRVGRSSADNEQGDGQYHDENAAGLAGYNACDLSEVFHFYFSLLVCLFSNANGCVAVSYTHLTLPTN